MTELEARAYHHIFDEPDSDHVVLTWPRTIPIRQGDRGWADMARIESRLPELAKTPTLLLYAMQDSVFGKPYADRLKQLLPHAEGPFPIEGADHFMQDDRGPEVARAIVSFLRRSVGSKAQPTEVSPGKLPQPRAEEWKLAFVAADPDELAALRADPLLVEQELDVRPEVAEALEPAVGFRAGRIYWRSAHGYLYAIELADFGRGRPSMATVYGLWPRWEPRPSEEEIDSDLFDFCLWVAAIAPGIDTSDVSLVAQYAGLPRGLDRPE